MSVHDFSIFIVYYMKEWTSFKQLLMFMIELLISYPLRKDRVWPSLNVDCSKVN